KCVKPAEKLVQDAVRQAPDPMSVDVPGREFKALIPPRDRVRRVTLAGEQWGDGDPKRLSDLVAQLQSGPSAEQVDVGTDGDRHAPKRHVVRQTRHAFAVCAQIEADFLQCFAFGSGPEIAVGSVTVA